MRFNWAVVIYFSALIAMPFSIYATGMSALEGYLVVTAAADSQTETTDPIVNEQEEELILDDQEEFIIQEKPSADKKSESAPKITNDSVAVQPQIADTSSQKTALPDEIPESLLEETTVKQDSAVSKPVTVEDVRSINFARNLKEYRSPKIAMLLSFLVPGAGQAYAKNYWKSALFVAAEAAFIGSSVYYNSKGNDQSKVANRFADQHYDIAKANSYVDTIVQEWRNVHGTDTFPDQTIDYFLLEQNEMNRAARQKSDTYYNSIGQDHDVHVRGWDDCIPSLEEIKRRSAIETDLGEFTVPNAGDSSYFLLNFARPDKPAMVGIYGYSLNQQEYIRLKKKATDRYKLSESILRFMLINHIVSAFDAGLTAISFNNKLLGKESFWDNISIEQRVVNTGNDECTGLALKVKF